MMFKKLKSYLFGDAENRERISRIAKNLLQDEAFVVAYESVQEQILEDIVASDPTDTNKRERLYLSYRVLDDIVSELERLMYNQSDQLSTSELDQGEKQNGQ